MLNHTLWLVSNCFWWPLSIRNRLRQQRAVSRAACCQQVGTYTQLS